MVWSVAWLAWQRQGDLLPLPMGDLLPLPMGTQLVQARQFRYWLTMSSLCSGKLRAADALCPLLYPPGCQQSVMRCLSLAMQNCLRDLPALIIEHLFCGVQA